MKDQANRNKGSMMGAVLFAWQLGGGLGHLSQMNPLVSGLVAKGHRVFVAARDLRKAVMVCGKVGASFLQAPCKANRQRTFERSYSFAHLLGNNGFGDDQELFGLGAAWRNLIKIIRPSLLICDHSPIAMLAARGLPVRTVMIGSGFCCPPDTHPLPPFVDATEAVFERLCRDEAPLLRRMNWLLRHWGQTPLKWLGELYGGATQTLLMTFQELDHYNRSPKTRYWGPVNAVGGKRLSWPEVPGQRIFAYVKPSPVLDHLLDSLDQMALPTIVYSESVTNAMRRYESRHLYFEHERPDPARAVKECDLAVLNGSHGSTCDALLAGRPILQIPLHHEQRMTSAAVEKLGAGLCVGLGNKSSSTPRQAIERLLSDASFAASARKFAERYCHFDPADQRVQLCELVCQLV